MENLPKEKAIQKAMQILGTRQTETQIIKKASVLSKNFFKTNGIAAGLFVDSKNRPSRKKAVKNPADNS
jgi:hypothetical protein